MQLQKTPTENWNNRQNGAEPHYIILHYTGTKTAEEAAARFLDSTPDQEDLIGRISPHYMIDGASNILQFVEEDKRAWHAGKSFWKTEADMNSHSIGIEIWNTGHEFECEEFIPEQIDALIELINDIRTRWDIPNANILGHSDIAPGRKKDPGEKFPWRLLEINGIGLMPQVGEEHDSPKKEMLEIPDLFYKALHQFGYNPDANPADLLWAFRAHYAPKSLGSKDIDEETCAAILSLLAQTR